MNASPKHPRNTSDRRQPISSCSALAQEPKHGYAIIKDVDHVEQRPYRFFPLVPFTALSNACSKDGWIQRLEHTHQPHPQRVRKAYTLTERGPQHPASRVQAPDGGFADVGLHASPKERLEMLKTIFNILFRFLSSRVFDANSAKKCTPIWSTCKLNMIVFFFLRKNPPLAAWRYWGWFGGYHAGTHRTSQDNALAAGCFAARKQQF